MTAEFVGTRPAQSAEIDAGLPGTAADIIDAYDPAGASGFCGRRLAVAETLIRPNHGGISAARKVAGRVPGEARQRASDGDAVTRRSGVGAGATDCKESVAGVIA